MHDAKAPALDKGEAGSAIGAPYSPRGRRVAGGSLPSLLGDVAVGRWLGALVAGVAFQRRTGVQCHTSQ
jgi:hypothetical protein